MKIYLIRHGETTGDVEDRYGGDYDDHLTERGRQQSQEMAELLKGVGIEIVYHSTRIRATETAQILCKTLEVKQEPVEDIRERNHYGILTGMVVSEAKERYPEEVAKLKSKTYHDVKGSEGYDHFKGRVTSAFDKLTTSQDYDSIAIVSHGGPISCIVREVLKLGETKLGDCAVLEIERQGDEFEILSMVNAEILKP